MQSTKSGHAAREFVRLFLQLSLAALYLWIVAVTFIKVFGSHLFDGSPALGGAWLGFWGNLLGGILGLLGGLVAAYAAVRSVERQLSAQRREAQARTRQSVEELTRRTASASSTILEYINNIIISLEKMETLAAIANAKSLCLFLPDIDDTVLAQIAAHHPTAAMRTRAVQKYTSILKDFSTKVDKLTPLAHPVEPLTTERSAFFGLHCALRTRLAVVSLTQLCDTLGEAVPEQQSKLATYITRLLDLSSLLNNISIKLKEDHRAAGGRENEAF